MGVGLFISILSFYILMLSIFLLLQKNTVKLENLLLIGYSPTRVATPYYILTVGLNVLVLLLAIGCVIWVRSYYIEVVQNLFPQLESGSLLPCILTGCLLFFAVSLLNILAIGKKNYQYLERGKIKMGKNPSNRYKVHGIVGIMPQHGISPALPITFYSLPLTPCTV